MSLSGSNPKAGTAVRFPDGKLLDATGWKILAALRADGRLSFHELGRRVGLTAPAAAERVRRLEEAGIIAGYRAVIPAERIGLEVVAFVRVLAMNHDRYYERMAAAVAAMPQVLEAHHVAGEDAFILKVVAADVHQLERVLAQLTRLGRTVSSIVLSSLVSRDPLLARNDRVPG